MSWICRPCRSRSLVTVLAALFGTAIAAQTTVAQTTIVVPSHRAKTPGNNFTIHPFSGGDARLQQLIDGASVCRTVATIDEIAFRLTTFTRTTFVGHVVPNVSIWLGTTQASTATMSNNFAANRGPRTLVFAGTLNLPTVRPGPIPANWDVRIKLASQFSYARSNGNLLFEIAFPGNPSDIFIYPLDCDSGLSGKVREFGSGGAFRQGPAPRVSSEEVGLQVGGRARISTLLTLSTPPVPVALTTVGFSDTRYGGLRLPFDLTGLGANGNSLYASLDLVVSTPLKQNPLVPHYYHGVLNLSIPSDSKLAGLKIFSQALAIDARSNALGLVLSNAVELTIARHQPAVSKMLFASSISARTGSFGFSNIQTEGGPMIRLTGTFR